MTTHGSGRPWIDEKCHYVTLGVSVRVCKLGSIICRLQATTHQNGRPPNDLISWSKVGPLHALATPQRLAKGGLNNKVCQF